MEAKQFQMFRAYQHFLYYVDIRDIVEKDVWKGHLTQHFADKFAGCVYSGKKGYATCDVVVGWIQEMNSMHQETLMEYILENHSNKW